MLFCKALLFFILLQMLLITANIYGEMLSFREQYIRNYKNYNFAAQDLLIKKNKDKLIPEAESLITEAMAEDKGFRERMYLLNLAKGLATSYKIHFGGDDELIKKIDVLMKIEIDNENIRLAEEKRWKKEESFLGNFLLAEHLKNSTNGIAPVVYPHWIHRLFFQCKVCHNDIFFMKRGENRISKEGFLQGKWCGACHNGEIAFGIEGKCETCHIAGKPESERLRDIKNVDHKKIKGIAQRLGAEWNYENLPNGAIPIDRFGFIDWLELKRRNVFNPISSFNKDFKDEIRDNRILFQAKGDYVNNVLFDHKVHSTWIKCSVCHPVIFKEGLNANDIRMQEMQEGKFCGHCHSHVSFTMANCLRCHTQPRGKEIEGVLVRDKEGS